MNIRLSDHFTYGRLLRFALPSVAMMIFTSIYSVVDGLFVANVVGSNALASINIVIPLSVVVSAFGFMLGTGGAAEVSRTLGEGDQKRAQEYFTMVILAIVAIGVTLSALGIVFIRPLCRFLGASDLLMEDSVTYGVILLAGSVFFMLQTTFQSFFVTAEKPHLGLLLTVLSGLTNMALDFLMVYVWRWGVAGAAVATCASYAVGGVIPLAYFLLPNRSLLRLTRPRFYPRVLLHSCSNGASEMISNLSGSVAVFLYNRQLMRLAGEDGVAAITVIMYVSFIFVAIFFGFAVGTAPVIGFHYGAENRDELKSLFRKSLTVIAVTAVAMFFLSEATADLLAGIFLGRGSVLAAMTARGFRLYSVAFLLCGFNIFASSFFTALCNGWVSGVISFFRTFLWKIAMLVLLPDLFALDGVWCALWAAEGLTLAFSCYFFVTRRKRYGYA